MLCYCGRVFLFTLSSFMPSASNSMSSYFVPWKCDLHATDCTEQQRQHINTHVLCNKYVSRSVRNVRQQPTGTFHYNAVKSKATFQHYVQQFVVPTQTLNVILKLHLKVFFSSIFGSSRLGIRMHLSKRQTELILLCCFSVEKRNN